MHMLQLQLHLQIIPKGLRLLFADTISHPLPWHSVVYNDQNGAKPAETDDVYQMVSGKLPLKSKTGKVYVSLKHDVNA